MADLPGRKVWKTLIKEVIAAFRLNGNLLAGFPESPFPVMIIQERFVEVVFSEIRPEYMGAVQFGIGKMIKKKI